MIPAVVIRNGRHQFDVGHCPICDRDQDSIPAWRLYEPEVICLVHGEGGRGRRRRAKRGAGTPTTTHPRHSQWVA